MCSSRVPVEQREWIFLQNIVLVATLNIAVDSLRYLVLEAFEGFQSNETRTINDAVIKRWNWGEYGKQAELSYTPDHEVDMSFVCFVHAFINELGRHLS